MCIALFAGCAPTKYVPEGEHLLNRINVVSDSAIVKPSQAKAYARQQPNLKIFGLFRAHLCLYSLSGADTSKGINRMLRKMGEPPVIHSPFQTVRSEKEIEKYYRSKGFLNAKVESDVVFKKKKANVTYKVKEGQRYMIHNITTDFRGDTLIERIVKTDRFFQRKLSPGMAFDSELLDSERENITTLLRRKGYYYFTKDHISFLADTTVGDHQVDLTIKFKPFSRITNDGTREETQHSQYKIRNINVTTLKKPSDTWENVAQYDSITTESGIKIHYDHRPHLRPSVIEDNLNIGEGDLYSNFRVDYTLSRFNSLGAVRSTYINFSDLRNDSCQLDCDVVLVPSKSKSVSADAEVTTTQGDFGFGFNVGWSHHNIFRGSEQLSIKAGYSQEAISNMDLTGDRIRDIGFEASLTFPRVLFPFISRDWKRRVVANTQFKMALDFQQMGYDRRIYQIDWKYTWTRRRFYNFALTLFDYNLVKMKDEKGFRDRYFNEHTNPILLYNYTDHQVLCMGFAYVFDNQQNKRTQTKRTMKASVETGGNLFHAFKNVFDYKVGEDGSYQVFDVSYSQFAKTQFAFAMNHSINDKSNIVYHAQLGVAVPYGNSKGVPFEKRFYAGGANGVRGWAVRTLGPGRFPSSNDYLAQTGDVELLLNIEYRFKLFWKFELGVFADGGNIWTIKDYQDQQKGAFGFNSFYKELAFAAGLGLRLDFSYFLIRFDFGFKLHDPKLIDEGTAWRIGNGFNWHDDAAFHFAVGYPF